MKEIFNPALNLNGVKPSVESSVRKQTQHFQVQKPINWWKLTPQERGEILTILAEFVPALCRWYGIREQIIPPCWYKHDELIQELLAFYQIRDQFLLTDSMHPGGGQDAHMQLQHTLQRCRGWTQQTGCNQKEHFDTLLPAWTTTGSSSWCAEVTDYLDQKNWLQREIYKQV